MKANIDSTLSKMRADMARQGEEAAKRDTRLVFAVIGAMVAVMSIWGTLLGLLIAFLVT